MANYITREGMNRIHLRMQQLVAERAEVIKQVVAAREMGDLSENAEYHAARERQRNIENEYNRLKSRTAALMVIDPDKIPKDTARFGAKITMECLESGDVIKLQLVGIDEVFETESDYDRTSIMSPRGKALIGKKENDEVVVKAPRGNLTYKILKIE